MSTKYKATIPDSGYFVTITIVGWIDIFTRPEQKLALIESLRYCQKEKGLEIYAYCLLSSHLHMVCSTKTGRLADIMRDFKKFTSKKIIKIIEEYPESRKEWLLDYFQNACDHLKRDQKYKVWQTGYHAEMLFSGNFIKQKIKYIHNNPVKEEIVSKPEDYLYSSARNYAGLENHLDITLLDIF
jgi:REP element-mobilizing transposase RayT